MKILFVSAYTPSPIRVRPFQFLRALARRGHMITLVCGCGSDDADALESLRTVCAEVVAVPIGKPALLLGGLQALWRDLPFQAAISRTPALVQAVAQQARSGRFDVAHIEHLRGSALLADTPDLPVVLDSVDSISLLFERTLRGSPALKSRAMALLDLARTRRYEGRYSLHYRRVLVSSPEDAWALEELRRTVIGTQHGAAEPVVVVPNGVDLEYFAPLDVPRAPATVVFSGKMSYHANEAAALFLVQEIMPRIWATRAEVQVVLAGSSPTAAVRALATDPRVAVTGFLPDLRPAIAGASLAISPLRYGVGIQNKVLEAMSMATPVVAARQASRALAAQEGRDLILADHPNEYAAAVLHLLANPQEAAQIGRAGRVYVEQHHSWATAAQRLEAVYESCR